MDLRLALFCMEECGAHGGDLGILFWQHGGHGRC